ncbi:hypothetical protein D3C81_2029660 [compost metagenome]
MTRQRGAAHQGAVDNVSRHRTHLGTHALDHGPRAGVAIPGNRVDQRRESVAEPQSLLNFGRITDQRRVVDLLDGPTRVHQPPRRIKQRSFHFRGDLHATGP